MMQFFNSQCSDYLHYSGARINSKTRQIKSLIYFQSTKVKRRNFIFNILLHVFAWLDVIFVDYCSWLLKPETGNAKQVET